MSSTSKTPSEPWTARRAGASRNPDTTAERPLDPLDAFAPRHLGPSEAEVAEMLGSLGFDSLDALIDAAVPSTIRTSRPFEIGPPRGEHELLAELRTIAGQNEVFRSYLGMGYHGTITPAVIQRNIFENPGWYTQYTPYQAEISQGRLEALLAFQTVVADLTGLPLAGASLLDEATAAAEAMGMCFAIGRQKKARFWVASDCHPQTVGVVKTRGRSLGIEVVVGSTDELDLSAEDFCGILLSYPTTDGRIIDHRALIESAHGHGTLVVMAADLLALAVLVPPGELGADVAVGSTQRFGVPMGFGGPHAAYIATRSEHNRRLPGRIIGVSKDAQGRTAYRMAIQTREQHIRRERATSNICTAQALLAIMAGMYAVYHGPEGIRRIAERVRHATGVLREGLRRMGREVSQGPVFDTLRVRLGEGDARAVLEAARARRINLRDFGDGSLGVSLDETVTRADLGDLLASFALGDRAPEVTDLESNPGELGAGELERTTAYLTHPVFHEHRSEAEMLRYLYRLQRRDLSLADSMIPLGSCTMKLNATSEMLPVTWPEIGALHPFAPADQTRGYRTLLTQLAAWLSDLTGFPAISFMPNAGSQGEYTGLLVIRAYHESRGQGGRDVCLIPASAHGTNPASAVIAGMRVVAVKCDDRGNVDLADLRAKSEKHAEALGALMITYPSTHGVFEESVKEICAVVHEHGGQVYMDGANMNAQVGLCRPAELGADVVHLNLHKTFSIPHGGGGPGMGPIGVGEHLAPFLPTHPVVAPEEATEHSIGPVAAATWGSASILPISWMYIALMGTEGLRRATQVAILSANYMAKRLSAHYPVLYTGPSGLVAHEFIVDCRDFDKSAGVKIDDIAKRLADYGFHAPTMSFPVPGTLMIEPTESEPKAELDRLCEALIAIRGEIREVEEGKADREDNVLKGAPHTIEALTADEWRHAYAREKAAYPAPWLRAAKFWPPVGRVDNTWGDRHLFCTCPVDGWADEA